MPRHPVIAPVRYSSFLSTSVSKVKSSSLPSQLTVSGWVKGARKQKLNTFLDLNDGSSSKNLQIVADTDIVPKDLNFHSCITVTGTLVKSDHKGQEVELIADNIEVLNKCADNYPFQPRRFVKTEFVRQQPTCKAKTNSVASMMRIRNTASQAIHQYFQDRDFVQIHTPVLTSNDCEGGGEVFTVTGGGAEGPYWDIPVHLTVSGQLHLEAMCNGLGKVYNFNPAFRAERGRTRRHLAEFWMVEAEIAFIENIESVVYIMEDLIKHALTKILDERAQDLEIYAKANKTECKTTFLEQFLTTEAEILPYKEAVVLLTNPTNKLGPLIDGDLGREHEQWLCKHVGGPVAVINWPKTIKPFYMREVMGEDDLVSAVDFLVEGVGELCGGSLREFCYDKLVARTGTETDLEWYCELRKMGSAPSGGFGLGFERLLQFMAGVDNIKDTVPFHRAPHSCIM